MPIEQPEFVFFQCPACAFSFVDFASQGAQAYCPLCAEIDQTRQMDARMARCSDDYAQGTDVRLL